MSRLTPEDVMDASRRDELTDAELDRLRTGRSGRSRYGAPARTATGGVYPTPVHQEKPLATEEEKPRMVKFSVCYSNKSGSEFASCGISDIEVDFAAISASDLKDKIAEAYEVAERMVHAQLRTSPASPGAPTVVVGTTQPSAPPIPSPSPATRPAPGGRPTKEGPPATGRELAGWAKRLGLIKWFGDLGRKQNPPLSGLLSEWSDDWAQWAYQQYLAAAPNGTH